jgi:RimJ/RimL family protein N-acetyltransferase
MNLVFDKERCAEFAARILAADKCWGEWFQCIGAERDGALQAVAVFNDFTGHNVEITVASEGGKWASRSVLGAAMRYAFDQLKVERVTAHIRFSNRRALKLAKGAGFHEEGIARRWFGDEDAVILGLLRSERVFK